MKKPNLIEIFDYDNGKVKLQYDENTNNLYVNGEKIVTKLNFDKQESLIAWIIAISAFIQAIFAVLSFIC